MTPWSGRIAASALAIIIVSSVLCAQTSVAGAPAWTPPKLADGQPDLQGVYTRTGVKALEAEPPENPIDPSARNSLSVSQRGDGLGPYPGIFGQVGTVLRGAQPDQRRTGIIDPPDRKIPWHPEEDAKRRQFLLKMNPAVDLPHVELNARCALPGPFEGEDGANPYTFLQTPGKVAIFYDYNHTSRVIHLDRKEHLGKDIQLFMGDSIGHWDRNTLVVDTTNFNGRIAYSRELPYLTEALHLIERFTIADENTIDYEVTIEDPNLFTKPWKVAGYFARAAKGTESLEFACAEGSDTLKNMFGTPPVR